MRTRSPREQKKRTEQLNQEWSADIDGAMKTLAAGGGIEQWLRVRKSHGKDPKASLRILQTALTTLVYDLEPDA